MDEYKDAMIALNKAAYAASRASIDASAPTDIDRYSLRLIARETDRLVDYMNDSANYPSHIKAVEL